MSQRLKRNRHHEKKIRVVAPSNEDRRSVAVTVAWMLGMLVTLLAEFIGIIANGMHLTMLPQLMLFVAVVGGVVTMALLPLVYRFRAVPPPRSISVFSVLVSVLPIVVLFAMSLMRAR